MGNGFRGGGTVLASERSDRCLLGPSCEDEEKCRYDYISSRTCIMGKRNRITKFNSYVK